jgi:hypothetical protein
MDKITAICRMCGTTVTLPRPDDSAGEAGEIAAEEDFSQVIDVIEEAETAEPMDAYLDGIPCPHCGGYRLRVDRPM